eukprot:CAMPEP_0178697572 /NCGR_PEP_ID=MMETSP0699-20121125/10053_1 /TAXON_ID=265572 /ORGANISM="Extubocellulus spinifer, Strain CCMP396" /LENGTH=67 /DNA_ID=CAMNT_0020343531 /DNA_START=74 /DNA_END=277 /DNA_ORIENTATION=+
MTPLPEAEDASVLSKRPNGTFFRSRRYLRKPGSFPLPSTLFNHVDFQCADSGDGGGGGQDMAHASRV